MVFAWIKRWRRQRIRQHPFPEHWNDFLLQNVHHFQYLDDKEKAKLREDLRILIAEKNWEGCGGLTLNDEIKVTIAAQAALLLLGFENQYYDHVQSLLVYPGGYLVPTKHHDPLGVVHEGESHRLGEAWYRGPVILSWSDAQQGGREAWDGTNVVLHEFAHQLDMRSRNINGTPVLKTADQYRRWREVMHREFENLIEASEQGRATLLDHYGAQDEGEFFAVATEAFFEQPEEMESHHPEMYDLLREYYRQDPAARVRR